jgi:hypothetical protein
VSRIDISTHDLFLRLGATPVRRSARADELFRRLRNEEEKELVEALRRAPHRLRPRLNRGKLDTA